MTVSCQSRKSLTFEKMKEKSCRKDRCVAGVEPSSRANGFGAFLTFQSQFVSSQNNGYEAQADLQLLGGPRGGSGRDIEFNIASETLVLAPVSPVPLPPALPLFAAALLALGVVGYARRAKDARPAHGQAC
jgi:hypothetical protein